jgi:uncharacterized protein
VCPWACFDMGPPPVARRFQRLSRTVVLERSVPVARGIRARMLGLAMLRRGRAGPGLLIPRCSSVHTWGMRFDLDLYFLDRGGAVILVAERVQPRRVVRCAGAAAVLEVPAAGLGAWLPDLKVRGNPCGKGFA